MTALLGLSLLLASAAPAEAGTPQRFTRNGVSVEFSFERSDGAGPVREGDWAEVRFRISDASSGKPLSGLYPAAWLDVAGGTAAQPENACKDRIGLYLKGLVGVRPLVDLNSYYLLVLNRDPTLSVIDPVVSMTGKTSLYATVVLRRAGADWASSRDGKRLYVSMPRAGAVAVVDTDSFKVSSEVEAGAEPTRVAVQGDGRYVWIGNDAREPGQSGVTVIDTEGPKVVARIPTGRGHHEIAFAPDDRHAFVTNREDGTVSIVDVATLAKVKDLRTGPLPIAVAASALSRAVYVSDAKDGTIAVVDPATLAIRSRIAAKPGLGPTRFSGDGRWAFVVNPSARAVHVVDASADRVVHEIPLAGQPYQVAFTRAYAYVRLLDSEQVSMVDLASLGHGTPPTVKSFAAGQGSPASAGEVSLADAIAPAANDAAVFVASPGDGTSQFYMEGMNAPMGSFSGYGHAVRAVRVVDRSLRETQPGTYVGKLRVPLPSRYDVAFLLDRPTAVACFTAEAASNPAHASERPRPADVEWLADTRAGDVVRVRFRLVDPATGTPRRNLPSVTVLSYAAPGHHRSIVPATELADGVYEAERTLPRGGAWYFHVAAPSLHVRHGDLPYHTVRAGDFARTTAARAATRGDP